MSAQAGTPPNGSKDEPAAAAAVLPVAHSRPGAAPLPAAEPPPPQLSAPAPTFVIVDAAHVEHAAGPTMRFRLEVSEPGGFDVFAIALTAQIHIDPARRGYEPEARERLEELFGVPGRWGKTTQSMVLARVGVLVDSFVGEGSVELDLPCTYDMEIGTTKYLYALDSGNVPLSFHFNGTVLYRGEHDRIQLVQISWDTSSQYSMPVAAWRKMIEAHYPGAGWVRLESGTLRDLHELRAERGLPTSDAAVRGLIDGAR